MVEILHIIISDKQSTSN